MTLAVIGATGATGRLVVDRALALGHDVLAVSRRKAKALPSTVRLTTRIGDVLDPRSLLAAISGADAVICCIGPPNNFSPGTLMSDGVRNVVDACRRERVSRIVMQSGITLTDGAELSTIDRCALHFIHRVYRQAIEDKLMAESVVLTSGLDWVIVRPVGLKAGPPKERYIAGPMARVALFRPLSFADCADCLVRAATREPKWVHQIVNVGN